MYVNTTVILHSTEAATTDTSITTIYEKRSAIVHSLFTADHMWGSNEDLDWEYMCGLFQTYKYRVYCVIG